MVRVAACQVLANRLFYRRERHIADLTDSMTPLLRTPTERPKRPIGFVMHKERKVPKASGANMAVKGKKAP
jgi:hypothetical protein